MAFQESFKGVSRKFYCLLVFQGSYKGVYGKFQGWFKEI